MDIAVYYKEGNPYGLLAETHEVPDRPSTALTYEEEWGTTTMEEGVPFVKTARLLMDEYGLVLAWTGIGDPSIEKCVPLPGVNGDAVVVVVPAHMLEWVERVETCGAQVWPHVAEEPDELDAMAEKLGGIIEGL